MAALRCARLGRASWVLAMSSTRSETCRFPVAPQPGDDAPRQPLRQEWQLKEQDVPAHPELTRRHPQFLSGAVPVRAHRGNRGHGHRHVGAERRIGKGGHRVGGERAPVVTDQHCVVLTLEVAVQREGVMHQRADAVIAVGRQFGGGVSAGERSDDAEAAVGQQRTEFAPAPCAVGKAVQAQRKSAVRGSPREGVHAQVGQLQGEQLRR